MKEFLNLGKQPIANGFLTEDQIKDEKFYDLRVGYDEETNLVSLMEVVDKEALFNDNYPFITGMSQGMVTHFKNTADSLKKYLINPTDFVLEIGCNDGSFLSNFENKAGIEPCGNIAELARHNGINDVYNDFLDQDLMENILNNHGRPKLIYAANTICHIEDIDMVFKTISNALSNNGWFVFEDPYLLDILLKISYDQIYDEHVHYFSLTSVQELALKHGLRLVDHESLSVHGGETRYYLTKNVKAETNFRTTKYLNAEKSYEMDNIAIYKQFAEKVEESKYNLLKELGKYNKIWAYGATSKSTVIYNYCDIGPDKIEYITDITPNKINKLSPGKHIPIINPEAKKHGKISFLGAWNHRKEIETKEADWIANGGKFITHLPKI